MEKYPLSHQRLRQFELHQMKIDCSHKARHMGISTWLITQEYNAVIKDYRDNIRMMVLYYNKDDKSLIKVFEENNIVNKAERDDIIHKLREN